MTREKGEGSGNILPFRRNGDAQSGTDLSPEEEGRKNLQYALVQRGSSAMEASAITGIHIEDIVPKSQLKNMVVENNPVNEYDEKTVEFVRALHGEGFIDTNLSEWHLLLKLYNLNRRELPVFLGEKIRLEVFLVAKLSQRSGDQKPVIMYNTLGLEIDGIWFETSLADEEDFISLSIMNASRGLDEDDRGLYRVDEDGSKWREPMEYGEDGLICDNTQLSLNRRIIREANAKSQKPKQSA